MRINRLQRTDARLANSRWAHTAQLDGLPKQPPIAAGERRVNVALLPAASTPT